MRVAIVHDWLTGMRGGEKVLEVLCDLYPDADIYTLVHIPGRVSETITRHPIATSFIDRLPWAWKRHQLYLPFFPLAVESFDLAAYDLVISSSHCVAKGALVRADALHICYCHTPMRYAWDFHGLYRRAARPQWLAGPLFALFLSYLRTWDVASARRPNHYIANSRTVGRRIERYYGVPAEVINPPVDATHFVPSGSAPEDYWLLLSAMVPYKRLDAAISAFNTSGRSLHVVGDGAERKRLEALAGPTITFRGWVSDAEVRRELQGCRGLIFPGEEDFGITPLEANACGRPVIALRRGGVVESQREGTTALFFDEQTPEAINEALDEADGHPFSSTDIRAHALDFDRERFRERMAASIERSVEAWKRSLSG